MGDWAPILIIATVLWAAAIVWMVVASVRKGKSFWKDWHGGDPHPGRPLMGFVWLWVCCFFVALLLVGAGSGLGLDPEDLYRRP